MANRFYAEFYKPNPLKGGELDSAMGSDGTIQIDGRLNFLNKVEVANHWAKKRGYKAFKLLAGPSLLRAQPASQLLMVE